MFYLPAVYFASISLTHFQDTDNSSQCTLPQRPTYGLGQGKGCNKIIPYSEHWKPPTLLPQKVADFFGDPLVGELYFLSSSIA
jgi:hypothetical protein